MARVDLLFGENRRVLREAAAIAHDLAPAGLVERREGECLYVLARRGEPLGDVVEIGAFEGRSTWYLARALADAGSSRRVISIDPHLGGTRETYERNIAASGMAGLVDSRTAYSQDVAGQVTGPLGFLWIDGDHSYAGVRRDFEQWYPKLAVGGWVAFHDTVDSWYGPTRLVRELLTRRSDLARVGVVGTMTFAQKTDPSPLNRLRCLRARAASELVTAARWRAFGVGPRHREADE